MDKGEGNAPFAPLGSGGGMLRGSLNIAQATCSPYRAKTIKMDPGQGEGVSSSPGFSFFSYLKQSKHISKQIFDDSLQWNLKKGGGVMTDFFQQT